MGVYRALGPSSKAPEGAIAVEEHQELNGTQVRLFTMEKRAPGFDPAGGDWEYAVLQPDGSVEARGALPFCARCHAEAPHDFLFGPRLSVRRHLGGQGNTGVSEGSLAEPDEATAPGDDVIPGGGKAPKPTKPNKKRKK